MSNTRIDIFPWDDNFKSGIAIIDQQHHRLVELINQLANQFAFNSADIDLDFIFNELIEYTEYHFSTEEKIWRQHFNGNDSEIAHRKKHRNFITDLTDLIEKKSVSPVNQLAESTLGFLVRWLASHILESDRYMAYVSLACEEGMPLTEAKKRAQKQMNGFTQKMTGIILSVYGNLTSNTLRLMQEIVRQQALQSELASTNAELSSQKRFLKTLINTLPEMIWLKDKDGVYLSSNDNFNEFFKTKSSGAAGKTDDDFINPELARVLRDHDQQAMDSHSSQIHEEELPCAINGKSAILETTRTKMLDEQGQLLGVLGISRDITRRKEIEEALRQSEQSLLNAQRIAKMGNWEMDLKHYSLTCSDEVFRILEVDKNDGETAYNIFINSIHPEDYELVDSTFKNAIKSKQSYDLVYRLLIKDGRVKYVHATGEAIYDENGYALRAYGVVQDITQRIEQEQKIEWINYHDALTGLPNRVLLVDRLSQAITQTQQNNAVLVVAILDLDELNVINDRFDTDTGDNILIETVRRIQSQLEEGDTIARIGGDEFAMILTRFSDYDDYIKRIEHILEVTAQPINIENQTVSITASIGMTSYPQKQEQNADQLLRQADQAMFQAKQSGKNRYQLFDHDLDRTIRDRHEYLLEIEDALNKNQFVLFYQPKINMSNGHVFGVEALIRWQHPEKGLLAPAAFLPATENHAISIQISNWVMNTAFEQAENWRKKGAPLEVSINIDALSLQQSDFAASVERKLKAHPLLEKGDIELEILETSALDNIDHVSAVIDDCRAIGIKFSMDDFGTGYSSLTYLRKLAVQTLKIDKSFVCSMIEDNKDFAILEGILGLAKSFKRDVIAEGVETPAHAKKLLEMGCLLGQGYAIARPMPLDEIEQWLEQWIPHPDWVSD